MFQDNLEEELQDDREGRIIRSKLVFATSMKQAVVSSSISNTPRLFGTKPLSYYKVF